MRWSESESHSVVSSSLWRHGLDSPGILQARILEWGAFPFSRESSQPRDRTQVSHIAGRFFTPAEPPGKPKNTGVSSLSLCQWIFPIQELNRGLLHCKRILYQLSYEGSSITKKTNTVQFHLYSVPRAVKIHRDRKYNSGYQGLG